MILVFDLDDTLYEERSFVMSGFKAVANYMAEKNNLNIEDELNKLYRILNEKGRGQTFDYYLKDHKIFTKTLLKKLIKIYRGHYPNINLTFEDRKVLSQLQKKYSLFMVTDGNKNVQLRKIQSLGIEEYFKKILISHRYGIKASKPSIYCFQKIINREKVDWCKIVYIGDDPHKDFINLRKIGAKTIRIRKGRFSEVNLGSKYEAEFEIFNLNELPKLINKIENLSE